MFVKILQVSAVEGIGKQSKFGLFSTEKLLQIRVCVISARREKQLDVTTMFTHTSWPIRARVQS